MARGAKKNVGGGFGTDLTNDNFPHRNPPPLCNGTALKHATRCNNRTTQCRAVLNSQKKKPLFRYASAVQKPR